MKMYMGCRQLSAKGGGKMQGVVSLHKFQMKTSA